MKKICLGMLAHVDSGKTTLCEEMLYENGAIRKKGRVDHGDAFLDNDSIEKRRGITIFSKIARLTSFDTEFIVLDTPGHTDFSSEMERTLSVLDAAVLIIGANDGITAHTKTLFKLLSRSSVPAFIFVNKMDLSFRKKDELMEIIKSELTGRAVSFDGDDYEEISEDAALFDEELTGLLIDGAPVEAVMKRVRKDIGERVIFPVYFGSALKGEGVEKLIRGIAESFDDKYAGKEKDAPSGRVFKVTHDSGTRLAFLKIEKGELRPKISIGVNGESGPVKINEIRSYSGDSYEQLDKAFPGDIVAVTGTELSAGDTFGDADRGKEETLEPFMTYFIRPAIPKDEMALLECLAELSQEDPKLSFEPGRGGALIRIMGAVQIEVLKEIIRSRYGIDAELSESRIIYKETLTGEVEGVGHFEPLRHYAEVHLIMRPGERGSGITVRSSLSKDDLANNWQNLIMHHVVERKIRSVLTGAELTDVEIELAGGLSHKKHTEGGDFREATWRAIRQGLMQAREQGLVRILEPWMSFEVETARDKAGRVMTDIKNMGGSFGEPEEAGEGGDTESPPVIIRGRAPASEINGYQEILRGFSQDSGRLSMVLSGYDLCHDEDKVIENYPYDPLRDTLYPADSVFCSKGSSDIVPWNEVFSHMHMESVLKRREHPLDSDETIYDEKLAEKRKREYRERIASDKELMAIFERTYGPVKKRARPDREVKERPEAKEPKKRKIKDLTLESDLKTYIFIDGYNLIHAWPELKELSEVDYGSARDRLIDIVCNYAGFTGYETSLVFDAYKVDAGSGSKQLIHGINVIYTVEHETADHYIEKATHDLMAGGKGTKSRVLVVSSDALVQQLSLGHGALRISSREFIGEISRVEEMIRNT